MGKALEGGGGQGRGGGGGAAAGQPARGITVNLNVIQKAAAKVTGENISGTVTKGQGVGGGTPIACGVIEK